MRIGIGLPVAIPGRTVRYTPRWAKDAEKLGFHAVGSIDRLVYDNVEPLVALGAAAAVTERVELLTCVLNVGWRNNAVLLAKQLATIDGLSDGRLTAGIGLGGWPDDFDASAVPTTGRGKRLDETLATLRRVWAGEVEGASGPMTTLPTGRPRLLFGGFVRAAFARAARAGDGWVAPVFGYDVLVTGIETIHREWAAAGRESSPRVLTARYFCLGDDADTATDRYLSHYYGSADDIAPEDKLTNDDRLKAELTRLAAAGCDDVLLLPCSSASDQPQLLAEALQRTGIGFELPGPTTE